MDHETIAAQTASAMSGQPETTPAGEDRAGAGTIDRLAVMLAALAAGRSTIYGLRGESVRLSTIAAMRALGARLVREGGVWLIDGVGNGCLLEPPAPLDFGGDRAAVTLAMGLAGIYDMKTVFVGDGSHPIASVLDPLRLMGVQVVEAAPGDRLPVTLHGPKHAAPIVWRMPAPSAEVKAAILLAALNTSGITTVIEPEPTNDRVERILMAFGVDLTTAVDADGARRVSIEGRGRLVGRRIVLTDEWPGGDAEAETT